MRRTGWLPRRTPLKRTTKRRTKAVGLPSGIRPEQRLNALMRDQARCRRCGIVCLNVPSSLHHRLLRSRGGTDELSNLLLLCGSGTTGCHGEAHANVSDAEADGFICKTGEAPADVPVITPDGWLHFTDAGTVLSRTEYLATQTGEPA